MAQASRWPPGASRALFEGVSRAKRRCVKDSGQAAQGACPRVATIQKRRRKAVFFIFAGERLSLLEKFALMWPIDVAEMAKAAKKPGV